MSTKTTTTAISASQLDPVVAPMVIRFPLPVGEWLPGYRGDIAVQYTNGSWQVDHSNAVDPAAEWSNTDGTQKSTGPEAARERGIVAWMPLSVPTVTLPTAPAANQDAAIAAIAFALHADEGLEFLRCWNQGDFDVCREEWPEAPEAVYVGADPLHPQTAPISMGPSTGFIHVGTLAVFEDKEATWGHAYDISAKMAGHKTLQGLDNAELYAVGKDTEGFVHVGTLSVFEDKDTTFGYAYDISTNRAGHEKLQGLDGAELYAVAVAQ
jgi:hypothetical protein